MLVLTRKQGESIMIGDDIEVRIEKVQGNTIRLSIQAPPELPIYRREIFDRIREENIEALQSATGRDLHQALPQDVGQESANGTQQNLLEKHQENGSSARLIQRGGSSYQNDR